MTASRTRRLAAVVSVDVVGYSRLVGVDEVGTIDALRDLRNQLIDPLIAEHGGRIVKTIGDGLLLEFPSVVNATKCAIGVQQGSAERNRDVDAQKQIIFRIGVNLGDVVVDGDDILGDGVNIAARLQEIAEPGGICISVRVYEDVRDRLGDLFESTGEQHLKNITRPVEVWRWSSAEVPVAVVRGNEPDKPLPLPEKPSVAILPFANLSSDAEQDYFADGMTEDIITALSRFSGLFVIARNSAFTYKGKPTKAQEIRRDLGVRYFVEGSVRKANERVRVTVQLVDSETGKHIWADRYDREFTDVFELQDDLTQAIVARLPGRLIVAEKNRVRRKPPRPMAAYDYVIAGRIHHHRVTAQDNAEAVRLLESAIQLDPDFAEAYAWKACALGQALQFGFCKDFAEVEKEAIALVGKALSLDENDVECHRLLCEVYMESGRLDTARGHNDRALAMNPNDPRIVAQRGELLTWFGDAGEGVEWIETAMRLDPFGVPERSHLLGRALYCDRRYGEAIEAYKKITSATYMHLAEMAACHARIGDTAGASELVTAVLQSKPDFTVDGFMRTRTFARPQDASHLAEGLRAAGLPA